MLSRIKDWSIWDEYFAKFIEITGRDKPVNVILQGTSVNEFVVNFDLVDDREWICNFFVFSDVWSFVSSSWLGLVNDVLDVEIGIDERERRVFACFRS